jgi:hypothetical protein
LAELHLSEGQSLPRDEDFAANVVLENGTAGPETRRALTGKISLPDFAQIHSSQSALSQSIMAQDKAFSPYNSTTLSNARSPGSRLGSDRVVSVLDSNMLRRYLKRMNGLLKASKPGSELRKLGAASFFIPEPCLLDMIGVQCHRVWVRIGGKFALSLAGRVVHVAQASHWQDADATRIKPHPSRLGNLVLCPACT